VSGGQGGRVDSHGNDDHTEPAKPAPDDAMIGKGLQQTASNSGGGVSTQMQGSIVPHASPRQHVTVWLVGVVLASLVPLLSEFFQGLDRSSPPSLYELLNRGDLLLISLVLTISGFTELVLVFNRIEQAQVMPVALILLGGVLLVAAEALWYGDLSSQFLNNNENLASAPAQAVTYGSLGLFVLSAFCSSACVKIAAGAR
jgi:uncharacterized membrane protein